MINSFFSVRKLPYNRRKFLKIFKMPTKEALLIIASSEAGSNLYYASHFLVPDPVIYFEIAGKKYLVLSDLEIDRAKLQASVHHFLSLAGVSKKIKNKRRAPLITVRTQKPSATD